MSASVEIRPGTSADDEARDAFVRAHERGTFFHLAGWRRVVERVFGHDPADLLAFRGGELAGVLPLMRCPALLGVRSLISMPYAVYGGAIGLDHGAERALVAAAVELAERDRVGHLELRYLQKPEPAALTDGLVETDLYWTFIKDLPEKEEDVLARMPKKARAEARKARTRHGLEISRGEWYVEDLYRLFLRNKHGLGSPGMPPTYFRELLDEFGREAHVHLVRQGREPLAAVMSFAFGDTLIAYYSGTAPGVDRTVSASNFMYLALQEWGVRQGYRRFDFGRSRKGAGAFDFKVHQGFEPAPLHYRYHLVRHRELPSFTPSNPRTRVLRRTWSRMPQWLVRRLSNRLSRYLP